jgi:hypothetical protein
MDGSTRSNSDQRVRPADVPKPRWHADALHVAQIDELVAALELVASEHGTTKKTLQRLQLEARKQVAA